MSHIRRCGVAGVKNKAAGDKAGEVAAGPVADSKVPYSYVTEGGEKYDVHAVSSKNNVKVETGTITFGNGDRVGSVCE